MSALNEVHGRIQARQRQKARPGRHFFSEAKKATEDLKPPAYGSRSKCGQCLGVIYWTGFHWDHEGEKPRHVATPAIGPSGTYAVYEPMEPMTDLQPHELTSDTAFNPYHDRLFTAAIDIGLDALHERRKGHSLFRVICSEADWRKIQEAAK